MKPQSGSSNSVTPVLAILALAIAGMLWLIWPTADDHARIAEARQQEADLKSHIQRHAIPEPQPKPPDREITYHVEGEGIASLTYHNESGGTSQLDVRLPWKHTFKVLPGQHLYLSAQLKSTGVVTTKILIDGQPFKDSTSAGEYVIAAASGLVPRRPD